MGIVFSLIGAAVSAASLTLTLVGFTPLGIAGGSIAATVQSSIGNVAAGSAFASLQSLGATGTLMTTGTLGAGVAVAGAALESSFETEEDEGIAAKEFHDKYLGNGSLNSLKPSKASNGFSIETTASICK